MRLISTTVFLAIALLTHDARANTAGDVEGEYSQAVVAYHQKDYPGALKLLDEAQPRAKDPIKLLELKALVLKAQGLNEDARKIYSAMIEYAAKKKGFNQLTKATYHFEMGMLSFNERKFAESRFHLQKSLAVGFNRETAKYLTGVMDFQDKKWEEAERNFLYVLDSKVTDLKPPSHLYLGQIAAEKNDSRGTLKNLIAARNLSASLLQSLSEEARTGSLPDQVYKSSDSALKNMNKGTYYGSVGVITSYDSNVLLNPNLNASSSAGASDIASLKETLQMGFGYVSSPTRYIQFIPSYRGSVNYNFNSDTATGQFFIHHAGVQMNFDPLDDESLGVKVEMLYLMRVGSAGTSAAGKFASFSMLGSVGPFFREQLSRHTSWGGEIFFQYQNFFQDLELDAQLRTSGWGGQTRLYWKQEVPMELWNPTISLQFEMRETSGVEFRSRGITAEFQNQMYVSKKFSATPFASIGGFQYPFRSDGVRTDYQLGVGSSAAYALTNNVNLLATLQAYFNLSNVADTYGYSRWVTSLGGTYSF